VDQVMDCFQRRIDESNVSLLHRFTVACIQANISIDARNAIAKCLRGFTEHSTVDAYKTVF